MVYLVDRVPIVIIKSAEQIEGEGSQRERSESLLGAAEMLIDSQSTKLYISCLDIRKLLIRPTGDEWRLLIDHHRFLFRFYYYYYYYYYC